MKTEAVAHESDLLKQTSTPDAQALGDRHGLGSSYSAAATHDSRGEIVVPAGASGLPTNSVSTLTQPGTQQVAADGEAAWSRAQVGPAGITLGRAEALVRAEAGSIRDRDGTAAALATAGSGRCGGLMSSTILHLVLMPAPYACFGKEGPEPDAKRAEIPA